MKRNGRRIRSVAVKGDSFEAMLEKLQLVLNDKILRYRKKLVSIAATTVTPNSSVDYGYLVSTLDVLRKNNIVNIGILTAREEL